MKLFIIFTMLYTFNLHAQDSMMINNIIKSLGKAKAPKIEKKLCCDPEKEEQKLLNQCALDLCGPAHSIESAYITDEKISKRFDDNKRNKDYQNFKPKLKDYLLNYQKNTLNQIDQMKENLKEPFQIKLDQIDDEDKQKIITEILENEMKILVVKNRRGRKNIVIETSDKKNLPPELIKEFISNKKHQIKNNFLVALYTGYLDKDKAYKIFVKNMAKIEKTLKKKSKEQEDYENTLTLFNAVEEKIKKKKALTKDDFTSLYIELITVAYEEIEKMDLPYFELNEPKLNCDKDCHRILSEQINKKLSLEKLKELEKLIKNKNYVDQVVKQCQFFWFQDKLKEVGEKNRKRVKDTLTEVISQLKEKYLNRLSQRSQRKILKKLENLKLYLGNDIKPNDMNTDFDYLSYVKSEVESKLDLDQSEKKANLNQYQIYQFMKENFIEETPHPNHLLSSCMGADFLASDHYMPSDYDPDTYLHLSSFTCNHYHAGKNVLVHELGHVLSHEFRQGKTSHKSYQEYLEQRKCVSQTYADIKGAQVPELALYQHPGDKRYTEEDMADFIAATVYESPRGKLLGCSLMRPADNNRDYRLEQLRLLNQGHHANHSTPFMRTLKEAIQKGKKLSPSCLEIIDRYDEVIKFDKCEVQE